MKTVLITGSSRGIGRETAYHFARAGYTIAITYNKNKEKAKEVADECKRLGSPKVIVIQLNLADNQSIRKAAKEVSEEFEKISFLINNAGVVSWQNLLEQDFEEIEQQVRTNLEGLIKMTRECLPLITEGIINIASGAGKTGYAGLSVYCATKFGVRGFTESLSKEFPKLRIHVVNPGTTATEMSDYEGDPAEDVGKIIFDTATGKYKSIDVDVWDIL
jgi:3-oxoacyl-[acyl-carrier protein] reductase